MIKLCLQIQYSANLFMKLFRYKQPAATNIQHSLTDKENYIQLSMYIYYVPIF